MKEVGVYVHAGLLTANPHPESVFVFLRYSWNFYFQGVIFLKAETENDWGSCIRCLWPICSFVLWYCIILKVLEVEGFKSTLICLGLASEFEPGSPIRVPGSITENAMASAGQRFPWGSIVWWLGGPDMEEQDALLRGKQESNLVITRPGICCLPLE